MPSYKLRRYGPLKNWYVFYSEGRRSKSWSSRTDDKALAHKRAKAFFDDLYAPKDGEPDHVLIDAVLRQYQDDQGCEAAGKDTAQRAFDHLVSVYAGKVVSYLNKTTHKEYEKARRTEGWSPAYINRVRSTLRAALRHAVANGTLKQAAVVPRLAEPPAKADWLTRENAKLLYRAVRAKKYRQVALFIRIALGTGARASAILQLTWDRIDLEDGRIDFRIPGVAENKKRRPNAPINYKLLRLLRAVRSVQPKAKYVIEHRSGGRLLSIKKAFERACTRAKIKDVTPHTLKHTAITWLLRSGVSVWDVSKLTATRPETIIRVYGHHAQDDLRRAANAVFGASAELVPNGPKVVSLKTS